MAQTFRKGNIGNLHVWADTWQTPQNKIAREKLDHLITEKSESRQEECWAFDCNRKCSIWVREVRFDIGEGSSPMEKAVIDTSSYEGPIPGFCAVHSATEPPKLATQVYFDSEPMLWGFRPQRWWVIFSDGTKQGGLCETVNPSKVQETYKSGKEES